MSWVLSALCVVALVWVPQGVSTTGSTWQGNAKPAQAQPVADIQFDNDPLDDLAVSDSSGSGPATFPTDDEDFDLSGSGSGSGFSDMEEEEDTPTNIHPPTTKRPPTPRPLPPKTSEENLSQCQQDRRKNSMLKKWMPECLPNGEYAPMQCEDGPDVVDCWCVDLFNGEIHGTRMESPEKPSCDNADDTNLSPCVFELVQASRQFMLGSFRPKCTARGQYEAVQCRGSMCYCVDQTTGRRRLGTEVNLPASPYCDDEAEDSNNGEEPVSVEVDPPTNVNIGKEPTDNKDTVTYKPTNPKTTDGIQIVYPDDENVNIDGEDKDKDKVKGDGSEVKKPEDNMTGMESQGNTGRQGEPDEKSSVETAGEIMTQPGILAGIIGGGVVLLLCIVLLIMFVVYRMRKKDEGSYPLDEPRRPANYAYVRTPDKEFYA